MMRFNIESMVNVPVKEMYAPDTLSRMLARNTNTVHKSKDVDDFNTEREAFICSALDAIPVFNVKLEQIIDAQEPEKHMLSTAIKPYWSDRGQLTIVQSVLLISSRIVILSSMCLEVLDKIHEGHQRIRKCREHAKLAVW